jgi:hypothetical protein
MSQVRKKIAPPLVGSDIILVIRPGQNVNQVLDCTYDQLVQALQQYFTSADGFVPETRTLTINGVTYDLSQDRSWTVSGGGAVDSVNGQTGVVVLALDDLSDVNTGSPTLNQILQWDGTEWVAATISTTAIDGANSRRWTGLNTAVAPGPGSARLRAAAGVTTGNPSAVVDIRISRYDETNADMQPWFTALNNYRTANPGKAYVQITDSLDNSVFGIYQLGNMTYTSSIQDYWTIGLTYISGSVNLFSGGSTITFSWVLFGADGTGGTGTVTSVDTSTGLTGGPITTTGTIQLNTRLAPADNLAGNAGKFLRVNSGETAVEYVTAPTGGGLKSGTATQVSPGVYQTTIAGVTSYTAGDTYIIKFDSVNDGDSTLNILGVGLAVPMRRNTDVKLNSGAIKANQEITVVYDGTNFQLIGLVYDQVLAYVHNAEGAIISKGQVVYAYEATGNKMSVKLARADDDDTSAKTIGLVYDSSIGIGGEGYIITQGVIEGVNTAAFLAGDTLYLSGTTFGAYTATPTYAPTHRVYVGIVERANANGQIFVRCQNGYELDEIHDVALKSPYQVPINNDVLTYITGTPNLWQARSVSSLLPTSVKTGSCGVTFDGGGQVIQNKTAYVQMPYSGTLTSWSMVADVAGACTISVYKGTFGTFPPTSAVYSTQPAIPATNITASNAGAYNPGMDTITAGDVLKFDISGVSTITWVNLSISITKT